MTRPKLSITKKVSFNWIHYRYYSPYYNPNVKGVRPKAYMIDLEESDIQTERELCLYLHDKFGEGEYWIRGHLKGKKGFWTFWKGIIDDEGFIFFKKKKPKDFNEMRGENRYGFYPFLKSSSRRGMKMFWSDTDLELPEQEEGDWRKDKSERGFDDWGTPRNEIKFEDWREKN